MNRIVSSVPSVPSVHIRRKRQSIEKDYNKLVAAAKSGRIKVAGAE
jgi:hypothetical protein